MQQIKQNPKKWQTLSKFKGELRDFIRLAKQLGYWKYCDCYFCAKKILAKDTKYFNLITGDGQDDWEIEACCDNCSNEYLRYNIYHNNGNKP